jgi:lysozyme family protein
MADPIRSIDALMIDDILEREGSTFTDDPLDRGGATKYGITQKSWDAYFTQRMAQGPALNRTPLYVNALTEQHAREFYDIMYVQPLRWIDDIELRELVLDCAVNHGATRATMWLQRAAGCLAIDGVIGPETRKLVNVFKATTLHTLIVIARLKFYAAIVKNDLSQVRFLAGWINRTCEFIR